MRFLGLDLAWGGKNTSGGCVLEQKEDEPAEVIDVVKALGNDEDILAWIHHWDDGGGLIVGIDAPLRVPNETGKRACETEVSRRFARFHAGPHPANRQIFGGCVRGEALAGRLAEQGITENPFFGEPREPCLRRVMEVFPHPAHIVLFGIARILPYKARPRRTLESRHGALTDYARHLRALTNHAPPLTLPVHWPPDQFETLRGAALKRSEDALDAATCAYIVYWAWWYGKEGVEVFGDVKQGHILVPKWPSVRTAAVPAP